MKPFASSAEHQIHQVAMDMVHLQRLRQVGEKGWTCAHDDEHGDGELACAAASALVPQDLNPDICYCGDGISLELAPLQAFIASGAFMLDRSLSENIDDPAGLDRRILVLSKGLALGVAELERLLRIRESQDRED